MIRSIFFFPLAILLAAGVAFAASDPQPAQSGARTTADAVYTAAQAARGRPVYQEQCAACHGPDLSGAESSPGFVGSDFFRRWDGKSLSELHGVIMERMPPGRAGAIGDQGTSDVIAYILATNSLPAGETELAADPGALTQVTIANKK